MFRVTAVLGWGVIAWLGFGPSLAAAELDRSAREQELIRQHPVFHLRATGLDGLWSAEVEQPAEGAGALFEIQASQGFFGRTAGLIGTWRSHRFVLGRLLHSDGSAEYVVALAVQLPDVIELSVLKSFSDDPDSAKSYFGTLDLAPAPRPVALASKKADEGGTRFTCLDCRNNCFTAFADAQDECWFDFGVSMTLLGIAEATCLGACLEQGGWCTAACVAGTAAAAVEIAQDLDDCLHDSIDDKYACLSGCDQVAK